MMASNPTSYVLIAILGTCFVIIDAGLPSTRPIATCNIPTSQKYSELFLDPTSTRALTNFRVIDDLFTVTSYRNKYDFPGGCCRPSSIYMPSRGKMLQLPTCEIDIPIKPAPDTDGQRFSYSCCETELYLEVPDEVKSLISGTTYTVVHTPPSYQLLHTAKCKSPLSTCSFHGTCQLEHRVQWFLVKNQPSGEIFVPVYVPNHCTCVLS